MRGMKRIMVLDGYNIIHRLPTLEGHLNRSLQSARTALVGYCTRWLAERKDVHMFYVVFDGNSETAGWSADGAAGVRAVFSEKGETADERILAIVRAQDRKQRYTVVSDDRYVRDNARSCSSEVLSAQEFYEILTMKKRRSAAAGLRAGGTKTGLTDGQEHEITDSLRRVWLEPGERRKGTAP